MAHKQRHHRADEGQWNKNIALGENAQDAEGDGGGAPQGDTLQPSGRSVAGWAESRFGSLALRLSGILNIAAPTIRAVNGLSK